MLPGIPDGQRVLVHTRAYRRRGPRSGDVVLVQHPTRRFRIVKRVAAVPGQACDGRVLGEDEYWLEGDNGTATSDSRTFGALPGSRILGKVLLGYWPPRRIR
jgi:signal peptidase I